MLNAEPGDKGFLDSGAKKSDAGLVNVQKMVCAAAAGILSSMQKLHNWALPLAGRLSDPRDEAQFDTANETIPSLGDVIALLGMASRISM